MLALIGSGHQPVADDVIEAVREGGSLSGSPPEPLPGMPDGFLGARKLYERTPQKFEHLRYMGGADPESIRIWGR